MATNITLQELFVPIVIAVTTVVMMLWFNNRKTAASPVQTLDYKPDPASSLSMTFGRYVGGHPAVATPVTTPFALLTDKHLALFARRNGPMLFQMPWEKIEQISVLDRPQMEAAAQSVRGLTPGAIEVAAPEATFLRVRFEDERGWWQNVILELSPPHAGEQEQEVRAYWERHRAADV